MKRLITTGPAQAESDLTSVVPQAARDIATELGQKAIPAIAKRPEITAMIEQAIQEIPTRHELILGDGRDLADIPDESVQLVVTSPPYWTLKKYPDHDNQLGDVSDYDDFLAELDRVWKDALRVLVPGGRLVIVVGDVCLSRRQYGRHVVFPLHASIQEHCRLLGFDNLAPIIWYKIANAAFEVENGSSFLGKPYEPNGVIKHDIEYILFERKPGGIADRAWKSASCRSFPSASTANGSSRSGRSAALRPGFIRPRIRSG